MPISRTVKSLENMNLQLIIYYLMKKIFLFLGAMVVLSSCSPMKYQVYTVTSTTPEVQNSGSALHFENEDCRISYHFWELYGNVTFMVYNKTDKDLVLDLNKSFFVKNDQAFDYVNYNEQIHPISVIPPKTFKVIPTKGIINAPFATCDFPFKITGKIEKREINFSANNSPIRFDNIITYSIDNQEKRINNNFYISKIGNYKQGEVMAYVREESCGKKGLSRNVFKDPAPNKFFYSEVNEKAAIGTAASLGLIGILIHEVNKK